MSSGHMGDGHFPFVFSDEIFYFIEPFGGLSIERENAIQAICQPTKNS